MGSNLARRDTSKTGNLHSYYRVSAKTFAVSSVDVLGPKVFPSGGILVLLPLRFPPVTFGLSQLKVVPRVVPRNYNFGQVPVAPQAEERSTTFIVLLRGSGAHM